MVLDLARLVEVLPLLVSLLALLLATLSVALLVRTRRWLHRWRKLLPLRSPEELLDLLEGLQADLRAVERAQQEMAASLDRQAARLADALQPPLLVHYSPFGEGHPWSFSILLADRHGNGILLTSIQGREEGRLYAKSLEGGHSPQPLSPEELDLLRQAGILPPAEKVTQVRP